MKILKKLGDFFRTYKYNGSTFYFTIINGAPGLTSEDPDLRKK